MKRIIGVLLFLTLITSLGYYVLKNYFPNLIPPSKDIKQYLPLNVDTPSPLTVPGSYKFDTFFDLKGELPRVLTFDENGTLFASLTSSGKVVAIVDENFDLRVDKKIDVLTGLNKPHGIAFKDGYLYVAETDGVSKYPYNYKNFSVGTKQKLFDLPGGGRHFTRTIGISNNKLYTSVGSSCDTCVEKSNLRASILVSNLDGSDLKVFAKGLRNTVFFDFDSSGKIWGTDMGRDNLGDNLPPDEVNIIEEGKDYGWPYCYGAKIKDLKFNSDRTISCEQTESPLFELPAHSAPLGFVFDSSGNAIIALHGSWNSSTKVGYKVIKLNTFAGGVSGMEDLITGFLENQDSVLGRPVGLVFDKNGRLFISDDKTGLIYIFYR